METLASSLDRLRDEEALGLFIRVFQSHTEGVTSSKAQRRTSEFERLRVVPLVFGLLPREAVHRRSPDQRVKPAIKDHLSALSIDPVDPLVTVLKRIADQYFESAYRLSGVRRRKIGIESVRALKLGIYERIYQEQAGRCAVCGSLFGADAVETLDHILPWRLAGDPHDGSNWQLLCDQCNTGKREWLSSLQSGHALNWCYSVDQAPTFGDAAHQEARYLVLACAGGCCVAGCKEGPRTSRLTVAKKLPAGLPVYDNLTAVCEIHSTAFQYHTDSETKGPRRPRLPDQSPVVLNASPSQPAVAALRERFGDYLLVQRIATAGMAEAFLVVHEETGEDLFLKRVRTGTPEADALQRELAIYQRLMIRSCENILAVKEVFRLEEFHALVCERAEQDLEAFVRARGGSLPTDQVCAIAKQIVAGLAELHSLEVVHRDLKPSNVLLKGGRWLLTDFGISKNLTAMERRTFQLYGTSGYAAPEQVLSGVEARPSADVYSLGKVLVFLLTGSTDIDAIRFREWRKLVRVCTAETESERISLADLRQRLDAILE